MTLRLILIRHAKSSWDDPAQDDHDRPLNARGQKSAEAIGRWLADKGYIPKLILSSTARRTVETWQGIAPAIAFVPRVEFTSALYHAAPGDMLSVLQAADTSPVLMLGHNPGTAALAAGLVATRPGHGDFARHPTAATTVMDFDATNWRAVTPGGGHLLDFITPRELL